MIGGLIGDRLRVAAVLLLMPSLTTKDTVRVPVFGLLALLVYRTERRLQLASRTGP